MFVQLRNASLIKERQRRKKGKNGRGSKSKLAHPFLKVKKAPSHFAEEHLTDRLFSDNNTAMTPVIGSAVDKSLLCCEYVDQLSVGQTVFEQNLRSHLKYSTYKKKYNSGMHYKAFFCSS
jgi:hypothetical protein